MPKQSFSAEPIPYRCAVTVPVLFSPPFVPVMPHRLRDYGLSPQRWLQWCRQANQSGQVLARIVADFGQRYRLISPLGELLLAAPVAEKSALAWRPAVGDWVTLSQAGDSWHWRECLERSSELVRNAAGRRVEAQVMAANVDEVWIVMGLDGDYNPPRLERWLTAVWGSGAQPRVVLSKADVCDEAPARLAEIQQLSGGVPVHLISCSDGQGLADLRGALRAGLTLVLVGSSGAGKSTLCNHFLGQALQRTQSVRDGDQRGRHTTTHRELIMLPQGALLIDGPGIRELQLWVGEEDLAQTFADLQEQLDMLAQDCRFGDCRHQQEPGCAVQAALANGDLSRQRWQRWQKLRREVQAHQLRQDEAGRRAAERSQGRLYREIQRTHRKRRGK